MNERRVRFRAWATSAAALTALTLLVPTTAQSAPSKKHSDLRRPIIRVHNRSDATVIPAHAPIPAGSTGIGPGSQILIDRPDGSFLCSTNFVWTKTPTTPTAKKTMYIGAAGHCFVPEGLTSTHGPDADFDRRLASVSVCVELCEFGGQLGAVFGTFAQLGPVAYARQTKSGVDVSNDFGIVGIPKSLVRLVRPSVPVWEGPSRIRNVVDRKGVCLYGNAAGFGEVFLTKARAGVGGGLDDDNRSWKAQIASFQGDSGTALVTCDPDGSGLHGVGAAGILTHISGGQAAIVGTTVPRAAEMVREDLDVGLRLMLANGKEVSPPAPPRRATIRPDEPVHPVRIGGGYSWSAGPFDRVAPPETFIFGEACSGTKPKSSHCDYEFVRLNIPDGGATMNLRISTADPENDFDVFVYGPDGVLVGDAAAAGTPPERVSAVVYEAGVYTIAVDPYAVSNAKYAGRIELKPPPPPPPPPPFDGTLAKGGRYKWTGDPPGDASPFTCADGVSELCDNEFIKIDVPTSTSKLVVDITPKTDEHRFGVCVYPPTGAQHCTGLTADPHIEIPVKLDGVYRVGVKALFAPGGTFSGVAVLK